MFNAISPDKSDAHARAHTAAAASRCHEKVREKREARATEPPRGGLSASEVWQKEKWVADLAAVPATPAAGAAVPTGPGPAHTAGSGPPPQRQAVARRHPAPPPGSCPVWCKPPSTSRQLCRVQPRARATPWAPARPAASRPAATRPASDEDGGSGPCRVSVDQCLCSPWLCSCFMTGWVMVRAGALTSMFWRLPSLPSTTRVTGTVSPSLIWPFKSISMTW